MGCIEIFGIRRIIMELDLYLYRWSEFFNALICYFLCVCFFLGTFSLEGQALSRDGLLCYSSLLPKQVMKTDVCHARIVPCACCLCSWVLGFSYRNVSVIALLWEAAYILSKCSLLHCSFTSFAYIKGKASFAHRFLNTYYFLMPRK